MEKTKQLLDKFYSGETAPDENRLIASLLSDEDDDITLFEALAQAELNTTVPAELEANIRKTIAGRRKIAPSVWVKVGGIAAAFVLLALGWIHFTKQPVEIQQAPKLLADVRTETVVKTKPQVVLVEGNKPSAQQSKPTVEKAKVRVPTEEELLIAEASLRLLGEKLNEGAIKAAEAAEQIQNNNSLKNILK